MVRLVELRRLDLGQNDFIEFPEVIGAFRNLTELWFDFNRLIDIPETIGELAALVYFDCSYNKITELSWEIGHCTNLTDLTLSSNDLKELPESLGNLSKLVTLRVDENELKALPMSIGKYGIFVFCYVAKSNNLCCCFKVGQPRGTRNQRECADRVAHMHRLPAQSAHTDRRLQSVGRAARLDLQLSSTSNIIVGRE